VLTGLFSALSLLRSILWRERGSALLTYGRRRTMGDLLANEIERRHLARRSLIW
jgi:hypothetical protein